LKFKVLLIFFAMISMVFPRSAPATGSTSWLFQASVYNVHYRPSNEHLHYSPLLGLESERPDNLLVGLALFRHSFGQFSQLAYVGRRYALAGSGFYAKWVAGVLHGYRGRYRHKVPYNHGGFSPALLPGLGYRHRAWHLETQFFWTNGLMVTAGYAWQ
jgi:hypothetical protein